MCAEAARPELAEQDLAKPVEGAAASIRATPLNGVARALVFLLALPIHLYRRTLSPLLPPACRYEPSCSRYALDALSIHGPIRGPWLAFRRILRCQPWGGAGHDPVPPPRAVSRPTPVHRAPPDVSAT